MRVRRGHMQTRAKAVPSRTPDGVGDTQHQSGTDMVRLELAMTAVE